MALQQIAGDQCVTELKEAEDSLQFEELPAPPLLPTLEERLVAVARIFRWIAVAVGVIWLFYAMAFGSLYVAVRSDCGWTSPPSPSSPSSKCFVVENNQTLCFLEQMGYCQTVDVILHTGAWVVLTPLGLLAFILFAASSLMRCYFCMCKNK